MKVSGRKIYMRLKVMSMMLLMMSIAVVGFAEISSGEKTLAKEGAELLTLERCIEIGLTNSKSLHLSLMKVEDAQAKLAQAKTIQLPVFKMLSSYTRLSTIPAFEVTLPFPPPFPSTFVISPSISNNYNFQLTVQQPLFPHYRWQNIIKGAQHNAESTQQNYVKDENEFIFAIKYTYWSLYKAIEFKKMIDENVEQVKAHLSDVQHFYDQGLARNIEVLKVQVQLSNIELMQIEAKNSMKLAMIALNSLIGLPLYKEIQPASSVSPLNDEQFQLDALVKKALENRAEVKSLENTIQTANAVVQATREAKLPQVFLIGNYNLAKPNQRIFPFQDKFINTWDVSVIASFDIWNWNATSHQVTQARAQQMQAVDGLALLRDAIMLEINQNYLALVQAKEKIKVAQEGVVQAEENHRITNERFKAGMALNSELLDAEVALLQAKVNQTQAFIDYEIAKAKLDKSIGKSK